MIGKELPGDNQAERAVLAGIMLDNKIYYIVSAIISVEDFLLSANRKIFAVMGTLISSGLGVDPITVRNEILKNDTLDHVGGFIYIATLTDGMATRQNFESYAQIIKEKSRLRKLISVCNESSTRSYQAEENSSDIISDHLGTIRKINTLSNNGFKNASDAVANTYKLLEARNQDKRRVTGIHCGIEKLDDLTTGFQNSDLIVISAKTGLGKTALAMNSVVHAMMYWKKCVAVFSLEMSHQQLITRMISSETGIDSYQLRTGYLPTGSWSSIKEVSERLAACKFYVHDKSITLSELDSRVRNLHEERPVDLVVVDYLQLVTVDGKRRQENRTQEVTEVSRGLKAIASDLNIPVIALSQLNGDGEMRESRAIEHDASLVLTIEMDKEKLKSEENVPAEIHINKNRNGALGRVPVIFKKRITRFL
jgi:replicative DNA helicase